MLGILFSTALMPERACFAELSKLVAKLELFENQLLADKSISRQIITAEQSSCCWNVLCSLQNFQSLL